MAEYEEVYKETAFGRVLRKESRVVPQSWMAEAAQAYAHGLNMSLLQGMGPQRVGHRLPATAEQLAEFEAWKAEYERVRDIGFERQWLGGGWEGDELIEPTGEWVYDEPEEDYAKRVAEWYAQVAPDGVITIPKASKVIPVASTHEGHAATDG